MPQRRHGKDGHMMVAGVVFPVRSWEATVEADDDDVTETEGDGWQKVLGGIHRFDGTFEAVYKGDTPPPFDEGTYVDAEFLMHDDDGYALAVDPLDTESGCFVKSLAYTVSVEGAIKYTGTFKSSGPVTRIRPAVVPPPE
jgi:hypothetical protein